MSSHIKSVTFLAADDGPLLEGILHLIPRTNHFFAGRETEEPHWSPTLSPPTKEIPNAKTHQEEENTTHLRSALHLENKSSGLLPRHCSQSPRRLSPTYSPLFDGCPV